MTTFPNAPGEFSLTSVAPRPQLATDVPGAVASSNLSRAQLYKDMRAGLLPAYKNGARTIIFYDDLDRYMHALPRAKFKPLEEEADAEAVDRKLKAVAEKRPAAEGAEEEDESNSSAEELSTTV